MPNRNLFSTQHKSVKQHDTRNNAGGRAYKVSDEHALAQMVFTGTFNNTFYVDAKQQLDKFIELANNVSPEFLAKVAVLGRQEGFMKDAPAAAMSVLSNRDTDLVKLAWPKAIHNVRMLRTFVQIHLSGACGRKGLGVVLRNLIRNQLEEMTAGNIFKNSIGNDPSMYDLIRLSHPRGHLSKEHDAMYAYIVNQNRDKKKQREINYENLPGIVKHYESYKKGETKNIPRLPFQFLDSLGLDTKGWTYIAETCTWQTLRMNLNTLKRHGVMDDRGAVKMIAQRLSDEELVSKAMVFPFQLLTTWKAMHDMPNEIIVAVQQAMEHATSNIPKFDCDNVYIMVDTSGSMQQPAITEWDKRKQQDQYGRLAVRRRVQPNVARPSCCEVAALFASAILRRNPTATVIPFDTEVRHVNINPMDSIMTNANKLSLHGGGTNCAAALAHLNDKRATGDLVIYLSDYESWCSSRGYSNGTPMANEWDKFKRRNKQAKLVCIDITPNDTTQVQDNKDILSVGGFNDKVFNVIESFRLGVGHWVDYIKNADL